MHSFDPFNRPGNGCIAAFYFRNVGVRTRNKFNDFDFDVHERRIITSCSLAVKLLKDMGNDFPTSLHGRGSHTKVSDLRLSHSEIKDCVVDFEDKSFTAPQASAYISFVQASFGQELQNRRKV